MSIEAMKQALEALNYIEGNYMSLPKVGIEAITSLRQAIAEAEQLDKLLVHQPMLDLWQRYCDKKQEVDDLKEKLAEAEKQEPRGYFQINDYDMLEQITGTSGTPLYETPQPCPTCEALARTVLMDQGGTA